MNKRVSRFLVILCIFSVSIVKAQQDSVIVEELTELIKESDFNKKRKYRYLDNNLRVEKTLIKIGTSPLFMSSSVDEYLMTEQANATVSIEKKISPVLSIIVDSYIITQYNDEGQSVGYSKLVGALNSGVRYYYLINKRIKAGIGSNNFHSNYFSLDLDELIMYKDESSVTEFPDGMGYMVGGAPEWSFKPLLNFSWGMQRRVGRFGFIDFSSYFKFNFDRYEFGLDLLLGFGLGLKK